MQKLLSEASVIPTLLEEIDNWPSLPSEQAIDWSLELRHKLTDIHVNLELWELSFSSTSSGPLHWPKSPSEQTSLWFPDLPTANILIHLWAFRMICIDAIETVDSYSGMARCGTASNEVISSVYSSSVEVHQLAIQIYQTSM
jgi:hypothetical protein